MRNIFLNLFCFVLIVSFYTTSIKSDEVKDLTDPHKYNFFTGMFDFSDNYRKSTIIGVQHNNENLYRDTFLGEVSPITGAMMTADNALYLYSGIETNYSFGRLNITPSFTPGYYNQGDGKDLGHGLEFKSEVQLSFDLGETTNLGMSYNHVSNASLGDKNPGANSYTFNFLKKF